MNSLPKSWGVYFEKSPGPLNPVIKYLNTLIPNFNLEGSSSKSYYGVDRDNDVNNDESNEYFETILTEEQFIEMTNIFSTVETPVLNLIESVDCEVISLFSSTDESKVIDMFKSLIKNDTDLITDEQIELCVTNKVYYGVSNYKVYLIKPKII